MDTHTFEDFLTMMDRVLQLTGNRFIELGGSQAFYAEISPEQDLKIEFEGQRFLIENDDLRSVWLTLGDGPLTRRTLERLFGPAGNALLTMLGILPATKIIQIQRLAQESEHAIELRGALSQSSLVPEADAQSEFAWA